MRDNLSPTSTVRFMRLPAKSAAVVISAAFALWVIGVPLLRLCRAGSLRGCLAGAVIIASFLAIVIFQSLAGRRALARVQVVACLPLLVWALGLGQVRETMKYLLASLSAPFSQHTSDGRRIAAGIIIVPLIVAAISAGAWLSRKEWRVSLGWLLSPGAAIALLILFLNGGWAIALAPLSLSLVAWALGRQMLRWLIGENDSNDRLEWIVSVCLGSGVIALLWLGLGALDWLRPAALAASLLLAAAVSWRQLRSLGRRLTQAPVWLTTKISLLHDASMVSVGGLLTLVAVVNLVAALAPDVGFDSTMFHLAMAELFARQRSLDPSPMSHYFYEQIPVQTLYAGMTAFSGAIAAKFLHFAYGALVAGAAGALAAHFTGRARYGMLGAAIFGVASLVWWLCGVGYVDLAVTFFFFAAICALARWVETDRLGWIIAAGLCAGIAIPAKLTNLAVIPIIALVVLVYKFGSWRRLFKAAAVCALAAFLIWAPWLWRSYLLTGNPVFPYGNNIFRSELIEPSAVFVSVVFGVGTNWKSLLSMPVSLTFQPGRFVEVGEFGAHLLAFSPVLLLLWRRKWLPRSLGAVAGAMTVFVALWIFAFNQNLRYLLPALPLLAVLLAVGCHRLVERWRSEKLGPAAPAVMAAALFLSALAGVSSPEAWWLGGESGGGLPYKVALGLETRENYLLRHINGSNALRYLNRVYGDRAQILAINSGARLYSQSPIYFRQDVHTVLPLRNRLWDTNLLSDPSVIYQHLSKLGFTHLLINSTIYEMSKPEDRRLHILRKSFLDNFARLEYADYGSALYKLEPQKAAIQSRGEKLPGESFIASDGSLAAGWETFGAPQLDLSGKGSCEGKAALGVDGGSAYLSPPVPIEPGRAYRLRIRARMAPPRTEGRFHIEFLSASKEPLRNSWLPYYPGADCRYYETYATAPATAVYARVVLQAAAPGEWIWTDEVSLVELDLPPALLDP